MNNYRNNPTHASAGARRTTRQAAPMPSDPAVAAQLSPVARSAAGQGARRATAETSGGRRAKSAARAEGATRRKDVTGAKRKPVSGRGRTPRSKERKGGSAGAGRNRSQTSFMKYASDNRFVRAAYYVMCGPLKPVFIAVVVVAVAVGLYFPVRDCYAAYRMSDILNRQLEVREQYNDHLEKEVDSYLSEQGIEDAARKDLGMVLPGETRVNVTGLDKDDSGSADAGAKGDDAAGSSSDDTDGKGQDGNNDVSGKDDGSQGSDERNGAAKDDIPDTSAEVEDAEEAIAQQAPWYIKALDVVFGFDAADGQAVSSTGSK